MKVQKAFQGRGPPGNHSVFVGGIQPSETAEQELRTIFAPYGNIVKLNVLPLKEGKTRSVCEVLCRRGQANLPQRRDEPTRSVLTPRSPGVRFVTRV